MNFKHFGVMLDCSRNAVMNIPTLKKYITILKRLGYNTLMLYTEDTYEVENQPSFGYLRGAYTAAELKEINSFAADNGIELIPCIQTLAHLETMLRRPAYAGYIDTGDIMLAGDDKTYALIDDIFSTLEHCFTSRLVNIGMDEAHMVGLGNYLSRNGFRNRTEILCEHVKKVCEIAAKHGFSPMMWSDMYFRLASGGEYYSSGEKFDKTLVDSVPPQLGLIYWDYYSKETARYDSMITAHRQFNNDLWFAGGLWTWNGYAPRNGFAIDAIRACMPSLIKNKVDNVFFTMWGDDGKECSYFAALPALFTASQMAKGIVDENTIKENFEKEFGISFDDFTLLDLPDTTDDQPRTNHNPEKYMTYNDCFCGLFDCTVRDGFTPRYDLCAKKLRKMSGNPDFGYIFNSLSHLCDFLQIKFTLGVRTRKAYQSGDKESICSIISDYISAEKLLGEFYETHKKLWFTENKPFGFEIQDIRLGGLIMRIKSCRIRLEDYISGKISDIPELSVDLIPEFSEPYLYFNQWRETVSTCVVV